MLSEGKPVQYLGSCQDTDGLVQTKGKVDIPFSHESESECLHDCRRVDKATGCEYHPLREPFPCQYHTLPVASGSGTPPSTCWVLPQGITFI